MKRRYVGSRYKLTVYETGVVGGYRINFLTTLSRGRVSGRIPHLP